MLNVYISGNFDGLNEQDVNERLERAESSIKKMNMNPVMPLDIYSTEQCHIASIGVLMSCDGLYLINKWHMSSRCRIEKSIAIECMKQVFIEEWAPGSKRSIASHKGIDEKKVYEIIEAIDSVTGVPYHQYSKSGRNGNEEYYARLLFVNMLSKIVDADDYFIGNLLNRDRTTIGRCRRLFSAEYSYNTKFRKLSDAVEKELNLTNCVSL
jgi:hypothetical protein